jgi:pimeloyl-ACP methyl ester carboxylesterase
VSTIRANDGTEIYYKDWGKSPVVTFSHGWLLCSDAWVPRAERLPRRRARSSRPWPFEGIVGSAAIVMLAEVCGVLRDPCGRVE